MDMFNFHMFALRQWSLLFLVEFLELIGKIFKSHKIDKTQI